MKLLLGRAVLLLPSCDHLSARFIYVLRRFYCSEAFQQIIASAWRRQHRRPFLDCLFSFLEQSLLELFLLRLYHRCCFDLLGCGLDLHSTVGSPLIRTHFFLYFQKRNVLIHRVRLISIRYLFKLCRLLTSFLPQRAVRPLL